MGFIPSAIVAAAGLGMQVYEQGEAVKTQEQSLRMQETGQRKAKAQALAERNRARAASRRGQRKKPDTLALLAMSQQDAKRGVGSTFLSGQSGYTLGGGS